VQQLIFHVDLITGMDARQCPAWRVPREVQDSWSKEANSAHAKWWEQRIARQKEVDASIAAKADSEYLYDKPYQDNKKVRVAGHSRSKAFLPIGSSTSMKTTS
jgi:adenine-specific DNA-methyltransferase